MLSHEGEVGGIGVAVADNPIGSTDGNDRCVCIDELRFAENGEILPVVMTYEGVTADPLSK